MLPVRRDTPLHRHQLVRLNDRGWQRILAREWDAEARACLAHWAAQRLPLVVTRQSDALPIDAIAVGLAAPAQWGRRRLALCVHRDDVLFFDEFPRAHAITAQLPVAAQKAWRALCAALDAAGIPARVYGSHGWQLVSGLDCVHRHSDVDVWLTVADSRQAELAVAALRHFDEGRRRSRVDGELLFPDGQAFAWREWQAWRAGRHASVLSKALAGPAMVGMMPVATARHEGVAP